MVAYCTGGGNRWPIVPMEVIRQMTYSTYGGNSPDDL